MPYGRHAASFSRRVTAVGGANATARQRKRLLGVQAQARGPLFYTRSMVYAYMIARFATHFHDTPYIPRTDALH